MQKVGFLVGTTPVPEADTLICRGFLVPDAEAYPSDGRYIQGWEAYSRSSNMTEFLPVIADLSFPTFFVDTLEEKDLPDKIYARRWKKAFIKANVKSLFSWGDDASVWPDTSLDWMSATFEKAGWKGPFAIREFIADKQIFYDEQRFWVLDGKALHPSGRTPAWLDEAARRLYCFSKSHYFTIDVAGPYIVEVNPGESSDRGGDTPLDWFADIFARHFLG